MVTILTAAGDDDHSDRTKMFVVRLTGVYSLKKTFLAMETATSRPPLIVAFNLAASLAATQSSSFNIDFSSVLTARMISSSVEYCTCFLLRCSVGSRSCTGLEVWTAIEEVAELAVAAAGIVVAGLLVAAQTVVAAGTAVAARVEVVGRLTELAGIAGSTVAAGTAVMSWLTALPLEDFL